LRGRAACAEKRPRSGVLELMAQPTLPDASEASYGDLVNPPWLRGSSNCCT
jgi:hypothetical protein